MADVDVALEWSGDGLRFRGGRPGGHMVEVDGGGGADPSPVVLLVLAVAGCMAADVIEIGRKMRLPVAGLRVRAAADRRPEPPRHLTALRLTFVAEGLSPEEEPKVRRALELSRDTYCSVLHSLRAGITVDIDLELR